jgi:hypothetical protein
MEPSEKKQRILDCFIETKRSEDENNQIENVEQMKKVVLHENVQLEMEVKIEPNVTTIDYAALYKYIQEKKSKDNTVFDVLRETCYSVKEKANPWFFNMSLGSKNNDTYVHEQCREALANLDDKTRTYIAQHVVHRDVNDKPVNFKFKNNNLCQYTIIVDIKSAMLVNTGKFKRFVERLCEENCNHFQINCIVYALFLQEVKIISSVSTNATVKSKSKLHVSVEHTNVGDTSAKIKYRSCISYNNTNSLKVSCSWRRKKTQI